MNVDRDEWDALLQRVEAIERDRMRPGNYRVTAVDRDTSTFTVAVPGAPELSGIWSPPQFLPGEGDMATIDLSGAQPIYRPSTMPGLDAANVANLAGLNVKDDPRVMGEKFSSWMDRNSRIVAWTDGWARTGPTTDEIGMIEVAWVAKLGHTYAIHATGLIPAVIGGDDFIVVFRMRASFDGSAPFSGSYIMGSGQARTRSEAFPWENPSCTVHGLHHELVGDRLVRVALTVVKPPTATSADIYDDNVISRRFFWVEDLGLSPGDTGQVNTAGGTRVVGEPPPPPPPPSAKVDGETYFYPGWVRNFRGDGGLVGFAEAYQGQSPAYPANGNMRSFLGQFRDQYGNTLATSLAGATIRYVRVWLWYGWWHWEHGGIPLIGFHTNDAPVLTPTGQYPDVVPQPWIGRNAGGWFEVDRGWGDLMRDGVVKGVALGPAPSTSGDYYGRANGPGQSDGPKIAVGWTR